MPDQAHQNTDKVIDRLTRRVTSVYTEAQKDVQGKLDDFTHRFEAKNRIYQKKLADGEITESQYKGWLSGQVFQGKQWEAKLNQITETLVHADEVAQGIINGQVNGVFAYNANWQSYSLEHGAGLDFGFEVYDSSTVARLLREEPDLLPKYKVNVPKDRAWNHKKITQQITQGVIQGEDLFTVAKRLQNVAEMGKNTALTHARTAMTGAQNAGRQESLNRAKGMGLKVKKEWVATLDEVTRTTHAALDGQKVDTDKPFRVGGYTIMYPGDPHAHPAMVYNCRCTMVGDLEDYPDIDAERYDNIDGVPIKDMTYKEWYEAKHKPAEVTLSGVRSSLGDEYADAMDLLLNFTEETDVKDLFYKYGDRIKVIESNLRDNGAYFSSRDGGIHFNAEYEAKGDSVHVSYQTAFHEFGHNIDWLVGQDAGGTWMSRSYKDGLLNKTIKSDYREYAKNMLRENPKMYFQDDVDLRVFIRHMDEGNEYFTDLARRFRHGEVTFDQIIDMHGDQIFESILNDELSMMDINRIIIDSLKSERMPLSVCGSLSDTLEYCTSTPYPLGVGHGRDYWGDVQYTPDGDRKFYDYGNAPLEFFAEVCDGKAANPKSLEQMRRVFPNAVKVVEDIIKEVTK